MWYQFIVIYLGGWVIVAVGLYAVGKHYSDSRAPTQHPVGLSIAASMLWPLLLVGMVELTTVAMYAKAHSKSEDEVGIFA